MDLISCLIFQQLYTPSFTTTIAVAETSVLKVMTYLDALIGWLL